MKNQIKLSVLLICFLLVFACDDKENKVNPNPEATVAIPDVNFKKALIAHGRMIKDFSLTPDAEEQELIPDAIKKFVFEFKGVGIIDKNGDGEIQVTEAENYNGTLLLQASHFANASSINFKGLEAFVNLRKFYYLASEALDKEQDAKTIHIDISKNKQLTDFWCIDGKLKSLDVSQNTALQWLTCYQNEIESIDVSQNPALIGLIIDSNELSQIDVSQNLQLRVLGCEKNQIQALDIHKNTELYLVSAAENQMEHFDVSKNTKLEILDLTDNANLNCVQVNPTQLEAINQDKKVNWEADENVGVSTNCNDPAVVFNNEKLEQLLLAHGKEIVDISDLQTSGFLLDEIINDSFLTELNLKELWEEISTISGIQQIDSNNDGKIQVSEAKDYTGTLFLIDLEENEEEDDDEEEDEAFSLDFLKFFPNIRKLYVPTADEMADLSNLKNIQTVWISGETIKTLVLTENTKLEQILIDAPHLQNCDISKNPKIRILLNLNSDLANLNTSQNKDLEVLAFLNEWINEEDDDTFLGKTPNLELSQNTKLKVLSALGKDAENSLLTNLNLSKNTALRIVAISNTKLTELDLSHNTQLKYILCSKNPQITNLDVSNLSSLLRMSCFESPITTLHLEDCIALKELDCEDMQLSSLNITKCTKLEKLWCEGNELAELNLSENVLLQKLYCGDNSLTHLDLSPLGKLTDMRCTENPITCIKVSENQLSTPPTFWKKPQEATYSTVCE